MKVLIMCDPGASTACAAEAKENGLKVEREARGHVVASGDKEEIARALWRGQTLLDMLLIIGQGKKGEEPEKIRLNWDEPTLKELLETNETFAVRSAGPDDIERQELNEAWGELINNALNAGERKRKVDLNKPALTFVPYVEDGTTTLGLSLTAKDVRKREYKVFSSNKSLRATTAAAALRLAGYTGKENILLPYENDGTLAIEATLMATGTSPHKYQGGLAAMKYWPEAFARLQEKTENDILIDAVAPSVQYLKAIQKNAKIAGVHKQLKVTKAELDWLDTKYEEKSKELVIAALPCSGKKKPMKDVQKIIDEFSYQTKYVLAKKGRVAVIALKPEEISPSMLNHGYKQTAAHELMMGEQKIYVLLYQQ